MTESDWQVVLVVGIGILAVWLVVLLLWLLDRHITRVEARHKEERRAARAEARRREAERDAKRVSPHPGVSCGPNCDITDSAHGYGGFWIVDEDEIPAEPEDEPSLEELQDEPFDEDWIPEEPVTESFRVNDGLGPRSDSAHRASWEELRRPALRKSEELGLTLPNPLRGNPLPMSRPRVPDEPEPTKTNASDTVAVTVRVLDEPWEPTEAGMRALLTETGSMEMLPELLRREGQTEAELDEELAFYRDPLGSWCALPEKAVVDCEMFWTVADEWMMGGEFTKWQQDALALSQ